MEIKGFPDYLIFRNGAVLSRGFDKYHPPRFLKASVGGDKAGYLAVNLYKDKKPYRHRIHRLLGLHFIDNPDNKRCIDHIDRDKLNNSLSNLRWATASENNFNRGKYKLRMNNKYGFTGVTFSEKEQRFRYKNKRYKTLEDVLRVCST